MDSIESTGSEPKKIQDLAFKIFAFIGFLSSLVTIIAWFGSGSTSLTAVVTEKNVEIPEPMKLARFNSEQFNIKSAIEDVKAKYCNPVSAEHDGSKSKNYFYNQSTCDEQKSFFDAVSAIAELDGKPLIAYDVEVTNDGNTVAENIKLRSPIEVQVTAADADGNPVKFLVQQPRKAFVFPDLNPNEKIKIRLLSTTPVKDSYDKDDTRPSITFSGGKSNYRNFIYVSGRYSEAVKFLDEIPTFMQIIIIGVASLVITLLWVMPLALISNWVESSKKKNDFQDSSPEGQV